MSTDSQVPLEDSSRKEEDLVNLRVQKIQEYLVTSLSNSDPLRANVRAEAGNLMRMGLHLQQAIEKSLARSTDVLQQPKGLSDAMETYLKITRQWDRLLQLDNRLAEAERLGGR